MEGKGKKQGKGEREMGRGREGRKGKGRTHCSSTTLARLLTMVVNPIYKPR